MRFSVGIFAFGKEYMHDWLKIDATGSVYVFFVEILQLSQTMRIAVKIVAIDSDSACSN